MAHSKPLGQGSWRIISKPQKIKSAIHALLEYPYTTLNRLWSHMQTALVQLCFGHLCKTFCMFGFKILTQL